MSLFEGSAPDPVELKRSTSVEAPSYLTQYLTDLATEGKSLIGGTAAPLSTLQSSAITQAPTDLARYQTPLGSAQQAFERAPVTAADISKFYDPYEADVVNKMAEQSALNVQRNVLPMLRGAFAGQGGYGSQRYASATGQALGDIQANLLAQQTAAKSAGYKSALDAALREAGYDVQAGQGLTNLGQAEQTAATSGLKTMADLGGIEQAQKQAELDADIKRAMDVASLMRGYSYPTTTTQLSEEFPPVMGSSPLSQVTALGSMIAAGTQTPSGYINKIIDYLGKQGSGTYTPDASSGLLSDLADFGG